MIRAAVLAALQFATPEPEFDPNEVTPTWVGFLVTFLVAVATVFLLVDMVRRVRRTRYRGEVREQLAAEIAESEEQRAGGAEVAPDADPDELEPPGRSS